MQLVAAAPSRLIELSPCLLDQYLCVSNKRKQTNNKRFASEDALSYKYFRIFEEAEPESTWKHRGSLFKFTAFSLCVALCSKGNAQWYVLELHTVRCQSITCKPIYIYTCVTSGLCALYPGSAVLNRSWPAQKLPPFKKHFLLLTFSLFHGNSRHCIPEVHVGCSLNKDSVLERPQLKTVLGSLSTHCYCLLSFFISFSHFILIYLLCLCLLAVSPWLPHR